MQMLKLVPRLIMVLIGSAAYLGLAVLGWGGFAAFFSHAALSAVAAVLFALTIVAFFAGGNVSPGVKEDRGNRWVIPVFAVIGLVQAYVPAWTDRHDTWSLGGDTVRWVGVVLFAGGGILRLWPVFVLGNR